MSVRYVPVGWNRTKLVYDLVLVACVAAYLLLYLRVAPAFQDVTRPLDLPTLRMQALGSCAFLMLTVVLAIGPLARLDARFLPLLYNRRHFGVLTFLVALGHATQVLGWYFAFGVADPYVALLAANTSYGQVQGFPFELFGMAALAVLAVMACTSHDFWLSFLTPPVWKAIHMAVYGAFAAVVLHVALGRLQSGANPLLAVTVALCVTALAALHLACRTSRAPARPCHGRTRRAGAVGRRRPGRRRGRGPGTGRAARRRGQRGRVPPWRPPVGRLEPVRASERPARRGPDRRRLRHLPLARLPVPARGRLRAGAVHREDRHLPAAPGARPHPARPAAEPSRDLCRARVGDGGLTVRDFFFIGYLNRVSRDLGLFLLAVAAVLLAGFAGLGLALGVAVDDPGDGDFAWQLGTQHFVGVVEPGPYPVLRLPPDAAHPAPRTIMLVAAGKHGAQAAAAPHAGAAVTASGVVIKRGPLDMLQLDGELQALADAPAFTPAPPVPLGRWRLAGEICDGKCYAGAMRPGRGLAHKACANLCLLGGVPPVFVSSGTVAGRSFFLLTAEDGGPLPDHVRDLVGLGVELEGRIVRLDDLLVFEVDLDRAKLL